MEKNELWKKEKKKRKNIRKTNCNQSVHGQTQKVTRMTVENMRLFLELDKRLSVHIMIMTYPQRSSHVHTCSVTSVFDGSTERLRQHSSWREPSCFTCHESASQVRCVRSRRRSSYCLQRNNPANVSTSTFHGMVTHSLEARSTSAPQDILRTPPVHHSLKPFLVFAQGQHRCSQVCRVQQRVDPVDFSHVHF